MKLTRDECYAAVKAQDSRFDGVFFTAVRTTGIYCRPVCKVRAPKPENCTFYESAAQAEANGYRPCLRCRPEVAPGYSEFEQKSELVRLAIACFDELDPKQGAVELCAKELGISPRHLYRVFKEEVGVSPMDYLMTKRLLLAKALLTDTKLKIADVAMSAGFGSLARFNADFKSHYGLAPSRFRKSASGSESLLTYVSESSSSSETLLDSGICIRLDYRPPYDWQSIMSFFQLRAVAGVEYVTPDLAYRRSLGIWKSGIRYAGWLEVRPQPEQNKVQCTLSLSLLPVVQTVIGLVRSAFDLNLRIDMLPEGVMYGIRLPGCFDSFEMSVRAILGQQITVKAAHTIAGRVVAKLGSEVKTPWPEVNRLFPQPEDVTALQESVYEELGKLGVIRSRAGAIIALAHAMQSGDLNFHPRNNPMEVKESLLKIKGIGPWTAEYLTMRAMSWPDAFPPGDAGIRHGLMEILRDEEGYLVLDAQRNSELGYSKQQVAKRFEVEAQKFASAYKPWRSYLTLTLWQGGMMKQE